jgi:hypothetical protein
MNSKNNCFLYGHSKNTWKAVPMIIENIIIFKQNFSYSGEMIDKIFESMAFISNLKITCFKEYILTFMKEIIVLVLALRKFKNDLKKTALEDGKKKRFLKKEKITSLNNRFTLRRRRRLGLRKTAVVGLKSAFVRFFSATIFVALETFGFLCRATKIVVNLER